MEMDYSTLNVKELKKLPVMKLAPTYRLDLSKGSGCAGDPPGYPSYFIQHVYTANGNSPSRGAQAVIYHPDAGHRVIETQGGKSEHYKNWKADLRKLWNPLPYDHERVQLWIKSKYQHFKHCYRDVERPEYSRPGTLIFPVPSYKLKPEMRNEVVNGVSKYSKEFIDKQNEAVRQFNDDEIGRATAIAKPDNHLAVVYIREFYPEHEPIMDWFDGVPGGNVPQWWETEAAAPTVEKCNQTMRYADRSTWKHPINGSWCQWCGWQSLPGTTEKVHDTQ